MCPRIFKTVAALDLALALAGLLPVRDGGALRAEESGHAVKLSAYDLLGLPGEPAAIRAKLEHDGLSGLNPDMKGYPLQFGGPPALGQDAVTDGEGTASASGRFPEHPGAIGRVRVRFPGSRGHRAAETTARLFAWPADSRILVVDIDHTICDFRQRDVPFADVARVPATEGSVPALRAIARDYRILYLTARDEALFNQSRAWLEARGFPEGPLMTRDYWPWESREGYKRKALGRLKARYPHLTAGVGDTAGDARAYLANGLRAIVIDPGCAGRFPEGSRVIPSWRGVRDALEAPAAWIDPDAVRAGER